MQAGGYPYLLALGPVIEREGKGEPAAEGEGESDAAKPSKFLGCGADLSDSPGKSGDVLWMTLMLAALAALRRSQKAGKYPEGIALFQPRVARQRYPGSVRE